MLLGGMVKNGVGLAVWTWQFAGMLLQLDADIDDAELGDQGVARRQSAQR